MKWRTLWRVLPGVLLPLPLVWLLYVGMHRTVVSGPAGVQPVPMLEPGQRRALATYETPCEEAQDCEPPLACFLDLRSSERFCTDSTCVTDAHCEPEEVCRRLPVGKGNPPVQACVLVGERQEGEACEVMPRFPEEGCGRGLSCQGWCGRPCQLDDARSCPEGFFCDEGLNGPSCLPTCEGRTCPEGQRCVRLGKRISLCTVVHGQDCLASPCAEDARCDVTSSWRRPGELWMECRKFCGTNPALCEEGFVCHINECYPRCDPKQRGACGPHMRCRQHAPDAPWLCLPDLRRARPPSTP